jgi:AraC-like DNA-binding protein
VRDLAAVFRLSPAYLLSNSYLSIKEITHAIGYEHTSSFIRAFERRFLQAPARYRKQNKRKYDAQGAKRIHAA